MSCVSFPASFCQYSLQKKKKKVTVEYKEQKKKQQQQEAASAMWSTTEGVYCQFF